MLVLVPALALVWAQGGEMVPRQHPIRPQLYLPPSYGPVLSELVGSVTVVQKRATTPGEVTFPIPGSYSGQAVIEFKVVTKPESALGGWTVHLRPDGINRVLHVKLAPSVGPITVSYIAKVFTPGFYVVRTQKRNFTDWAGPTVTVQSDDPDIRRVAAQLQEGKPSPDKLIERVVKWVAANEFSQVAPTLLSDAKATLEHGGDALGRANLAAAILRACKVPTRIIAYRPTWGEWRDQPSWLIEYQSEEGTWAMAEPFLGISQPVRNTEVILAIASRIDENHSVARPTAVRPDAPVLATPEISDHLAWAGEPHGKTLIHVIEEFPRASGSRLMPGALRRSLKVIAAAEKGIASWYDPTLLKKEISKGPTNLALFLDEKPTLPDRQK